MQSLVGRCAALPGSQPRGEWRVSDHEGGWHFTETVVANLLDDPHVRGLVFTSRDIGERIRFQSELSTRPSTTPSPGWPTASFSRTAWSTHSAGRRRTTVAVLFMDIDDFKLVNDSYGHVQGDSLLVQAADRLTGILRAGDTAARLGGDEFAILLEGVKDADEACVAARRVLELFGEDFRLDTTHLSVSVSIGVALSDGSHKSAEELLRDADVAMYSAKAHGKDRSGVFRAGHAGGGTRSAWSSPTSCATPWTTTSSWSSTSPSWTSPRSASSAWRRSCAGQHPRQGLKPPGWFIHVAEETGLIIPIGDLVLARPAASSATGRTQLGEPSLRMAVNLSPWSAQGPPTRGEGASRAGGHGHRPGRLTLEITETALVRRATPP